jgi:tol-pal system protein YbgF
MSLLMGCATTGGSSQMQTTVYDLHRRVVSLEHSNQTSVGQITDTAATLTAKVNENDDQIRRIGGQLEENQVRIDSLAADLTDLRQQLARRFGGTVTSPTTSTTPTPSPAPTVEAVVGAPEIVAPTSSVVVPPAGVVAPVVTTPPANASGDAEAVYLRALTAFGSDNFSEAHRLFDEYLRQYPNADKRLDAMFWRANSQLKLGQYQDAVNSFNTLRTQHPTSDKVAYSTYNEAIGYARLGQRDRAEQLLQEVVTNYPTSPAAEEARRSLEVLRQSP